MSTEPCVDFSLDPKAAARITVLHDARDCWNDSMTANWSRYTIAGKPADLFEPDGARPRFALIYLHAACERTLLDDATFTRLFEEMRLACICPYGGPAWWSDRLCREFDADFSAEKHLLRNVVPFVKEHWGLASSALGLLGFGMGGQGALRLSFKQPELFSVVAALAPSIEYYELYGAGTAIDAMYSSKEQCRQDTASLHIHPSRYPAHIFYTVDRADRAWYRGNDRLHEKLNALGVPHQFEPLDNLGGHTWTFATRAARRAVEFMVAGLEQQSRRLL